MANTGCYACKLIYNFVFIQLDPSTSENETFQRPAPLSTGEERGLLYYAYCLYKDFLFIVCNSNK
jgi:hypothetical protein